MQDEIVARGKRVIIRRRRIADATDEYNWRTDVELCRYDAVPPVNVDFADYLRGWRLNLYFTDAGQRSFALEDENGRHIGNVMYYNINSGRGEAELGISVGAKHRWGLGYGSDALAAMLGFIFQEHQSQLDLHAYFRLESSGSALLPQGGVPRMQHLLAGRSLLRNNANPAGAVEGAAFFCE